MVSDATDLIRGRGTFVDDVARPGMLHLNVVRSPYARARLLRVDGGITAKELRANLAAVGEHASGDVRGIAYPVLASDVVNFVGQPVAAVVGSDPYRAEDLAASVEVEYERLRPVVDPEQALRAGPIHRGTTSNVFAHERLGRPFSADVSIVIEETLRNERVIPNPLETRGLIAQYDGGRLTVWASTQSPHSFREGLSESLGLSPDAIRVVGMDTGGAFGSKGGLYPEYVIAAHAAMTSKRPVKWIESRREHLVATHQGRGIRARMKLHADRTGLVHGLEADLLVDGGAYPGGIGRGMPGWIAYQLTGPYAIRNAHVNGTTVCTNKVPLGPYRGAGRPEAAFFLERMMDVLADELKMDPVDVRLRNASANPFTSPLELEVPPFRPFLESAVRELGYRERAPHGNVGFSAFILIPDATSGEGARIRVHEGRITVWLGGHSHGQGHEAFVRSIVSEQLEVPPEAIDVEAADTDAVPRGVGSWGSRSAILGGGAVVAAAREVRTQAKRTLGTYDPGALLRGTYDATVFYEQDDPLHSFGANLVAAEVEETGHVRVTECASYYDVGRALNPAMVEGQVVGGAVQGIGQVLYEQAGYDEDGNPLVGSLADAGLPTSAEGTRFVVKLATDPSPLPHGAKGVGESPTIGVPPALVRAIERAAGKRMTHTPIGLEELARVPKRRALRSDEA